MSRPILKLLVRNDEDNRSLFELVEPFSIEIGPGCKIIVPAGYITNFGTVPRWCAWFVSPAQLKEASIVHDFMCNEHFGHPSQKKISGYSRWLADAVFYEMMVQMRFPWYKRTAVFYAVRLWACVGGRSRS